MIKTEFRESLRRIGRQPGSYVVATVTLMIGLAVGVTMFTLVESILLRPLPFRDQDRLVMLWASDTRRNIPRLEINWDELERFRKEGNSFEELAAYAAANTGTVITRRGEPMQLSGNIVSESFFRILGVRAHRGRLFKPEEHKAGGPGVAVMSHAAWTGLFGADPRIIGETMSSDGTPVEIVGILPPHFDLPDDAQILFPLEAAVPNEEDRNFRVLAGLGKLRPGVSLETARTEIRNLAGRMEQERPETHGGITSLAFPLVDEALGTTRPALRLLFAMAIALLFIAFSNVANVFLTRAIARQRELALRVALGATRWTLIRQLSWEALLTTAVAAIGGFLLAHLALRTLIRIAPENLPRLSEIRISPATYLFLASISLLIGLALAWFSTRRPARLDLTRALAEGGRSGGLGRETRSLLDLVVVMQISLTLVLLVGASIFIRGFLDMNRIEVGFQKENVITMHLPRGYVFGEKAAERRMFFNRLFDRVRGLPDVVAVGSVLMRPLEIEQGWDFTYTVQGQGPAEQDLNPLANLLSATPGYFEAMGVRLIRGRTFNDSDTSESEPIAVVSESFARRLGGTDQALGRMIKSGKPDSNKPWVKIVGVVSDVRYRALTTEKMDLYVPFTQTIWSPNYLAVRTRGNPAMALSAIRGIVREMEPETPVASVKTTAELVGSKLAQPRLNMIVVTTFAVVGVFLSFVGLYSLLAYVISRRTAEFGIRMSLGATARDLRKLVLRESVRLSGAGVLVGIAATLIVIRLLSSWMAGIGSTHPVVIAGTAAALIALAVVASLRPAVRAASTDPAIVLRAE